MLKRTLWSLCCLALLSALPPERVEAAVISPDAPTTTVPSYLSDGSYLFGITVALGPDQFLLPVDISGAGLQAELIFLRQYVVQEVLPR
jgi:hypothetical protein